MSMEIQCECGQFKAELTRFPKNTPGRFTCYCDDCQAFLHFIKREELLDQNGGSEIIPAYPADFKITSGINVLKCVRLSPKGMYRFYTSCCSYPVANTDPVRPWVGIMSGMYKAKNPDILDQQLGPNKISFMGQFAKGTPPPGTPDKIDFKGIVAVLPFLVKGKLLKKAKPSPFFDNGECIVTPKVLTLEERRQITPN